MNDNRPIDRPPIRPTLIIRNAGRALALCLAGALSGCYTQLEKPGTYEPVDESSRTQAEEPAPPHSGGPGGGRDPHEGIAWMSEYDRDWETLAVMKSEIKALAGDGSCAGHGNCKVIWLEGNASFGVGSWFVYSDFMLDEREFQARVYEHNDFASYLLRKWDIRRLAIGPPLEPPTVRCDFGKCVIGYRRD